MRTELDKALLAFVLFTPWITLGWVVIDAIRFGKEKTP